MADEEDDSTSLGFFEAGSPVLFANAADRGCPIGTGAIGGKPTHKGAMTRGEEGVTEALFWPAEDVAFVMSTSITMANKEGKNFQANEYNTIQGLRFKEDEAITAK